MICILTSCPQLLESWTWSHRNKDYSQEQAGKHSQSAEDEPCVPESSAAVTRVRKGGKGRDLGRLGL